MRSLVMVQVDQLGRFSDAAQCRLAHALLGSDKGDHGAVVVSVHLAVEQVNVRAGKDGA